MQTWWMVSREFKKNGGKCSGELLLCSCRGSQASVPVRKRSLQTWALALAVSATFYSVVGEIFMNNINLWNYKKKKKMFFLSVGAISAAVNSAKHCNFSLRDRSSATKLLFTSCPPTELRDVRWKQPLEVVAAAWINSDIEHPEHSNRIEQTLLMPLAGNLCLCYSSNGYARQKQYQCYVFQWQQHQKVAAIKSNNKKTW